MKQIIMIPRFLMLALALCTTLRLFAQSVETELQDYFYPFAKFSYIATPNSEEPKLVNTYKLSNGNILTKTVEMYNGYRSNKISEEAFKLSIDEENQAIVSTQQIIQNMMGTRRASDKIIMFLLPKEGNPVSWTESVNGEKSDCSAKIVYISFTHEGKKLYRKAVKIEKTTPLDKTSAVKEWSYWVKGLSRLATYGYWGNPNKVSCIDKSVNISLDDSITEISKSEFNINSKGSDE